MRGHVWKALLLALFFAGFVPAALACELSARGDAPCGNIACEQNQPVVDCFTSDAVESAALPSAVQDAPKAPDIHAAALELGQKSLSLLRDSLPPSPLQRNHVDSPPTTLVGQSVLLRI